ncbi:S-adenosyl-L-methionine-dependent methyltransferase [Cristinia sonorae]|uniref:S-adenosyl-L-methionine-dependent methyltransferase n=1 Tax=Cristinia sonorae TaxID=1940300 RepID=A0A8K0UM83_9AGAR|nr:S-adenosyl-L-methionine-dependent methyltransferase [Cristinia sonorae]
MATLTVTEKTEKLRAAVKLLNEATEQVIKAWEDDESKPIDGSGSAVPSKALYDGRRTVLGTIGIFLELVQEPQARLMEVTHEFYEARALQIAAEARIPDILAEGDPKTGVPIEELSKRTGIKDHKLCRVLRALCSVHIFREVSNNHFANNTVSQVLVGNDPLRAFVLALGYDIYTASTAFPQVLFDPVKTQAETDSVTAFQDAHNTTLTRWDWMEQPEVLPDGTTRPRKELANFTMAMLGGGRVMGPPLYTDFPWADLGQSTVVDVGGGIGGMSLDLAKRYPNLSFIIQDREPVLKQAHAVWSKELPSAIQTERVKFMVHNFFNEEPVKNADVYHMRYILHDWSDDDCVAILSAIRPALGPNSRILISDQVMNTTCGTDAIASAPAPLPANYGYGHRFQNLRDLNMMCLFNGRERTADEFAGLAARSGLKVAKIWEVRGMVSITEMRLADP